HAVDIGTGTEPSPGSGDDHHPDGIIEAQSGEVVAKALTHVDGECVELVWTVEHNLCDRTLDSQINRHAAFSDEVSIQSFGRMPGRIPPTKPPMRDARDGGRRSIGVG